MEFEEKLKSYRVNKQRQELITNGIAKVKKMLSAVVGGKVKPDDDVIVNIADSDNDSISKDDSNSKTNSKRKLMENTRKHTKRKPKLELDEDENASSIDDEGIELLDSETSAQKTWIDYATYVIYFLFWATVYAIAIQLKFGAVYFILSCLVGMYLNTRTEKKRKDEISAYSVFNSNLESIDGTLKAEQLERQFGIRA